LAIDLLMCRMPEIADRAIEASRQFQAGTRAFDQGGEERVGEGHVDWDSEARAALSHQMTAASRVPWSIARFASSTAATSAPPIKCTMHPAVFKSSYSSRSGSCPVHSTTLSTASTCSAPLILTCKPASSILR